jgi:hypothetical protein
MQVHAQHHLLLREYPFAPVGKKRLNPLIVIVGQLPPSPLDQ